MNEQMNIQMIKGINKQTQRVVNRKFDLQVQSPMFEGALMKP